MTGATLSEAVPQANQVTTDYNVAMQAAQGTVSNDELATAQTLPGSVAQAEAQVMSELNQQATMQAAQTSTDEFTRTQAQAVEQQMSEVPKEATVQGQLENLMAQFADGKTPALLQVLYVMQTLLWLKEVYLQVLWQVWLSCKLQWNLLYL